MERSEHEINELITAAQRAYAEKDMCELRLAEMLRKSDDECGVIEAKLAECERESSEIDETIRQREAEVEEVKRETAAAVAEARREEEAREREMEHFASVRDRRLELARRHTSLVHTSPPPFDLPPNHLTQPPAPSSSPHLHPLADACAVLSVSPGSLASLCSAVASMALSRELHAKRPC